MNRISVKVINLIIDKYNELYHKDIRAVRRDRELVIPRQCLFYILRKQYNMPYQQIGDVFGMNHASVIHGERVIDDMLSIGDRETEDTLGDLVDLFREYSLNIDNYISSKSEIIDNLTKMLKSLRAVDILSQNEVQRIVNNVFKTEPSEVA